MDVNEWCPLFITV